MARAQELAERAELMICVGSSLAVYPVAGLPRLTLERGGRLAIVTKGPTPYDGDAELKLGGEVDEELVALLAALGPERPSLAVGDDPGLAAGVATIVSARGPRRSRRGRRSRPLRSRSR